jgi:hypothetical protein
MGMRIQLGKQGCAAGAKIPLGLRRGGGRRGQVRSDGEGLTSNNRMQLAGASCLRSVR